MRKVSFRVQRRIRLKLIGLVIPSPVGLAIVIGVLRILIECRLDLDLYAMLGLQKQAKTLFYRLLQHHLRHSRDNFQIAPGVRGMVMLVFSLPSFPFVFKMIKDRFDPPKTSTREEVRQKYLLVKNHDRVGRLADTLEYSNVAIPLSRIEPALMEALHEEAAGSIEIDGDRLVIGHIYIERRMEPLDNYLAAASRRQRDISRCASGIGPCDTSRLTESERAELTRAQRQRMVSDCRLGFARCDESQLTDSETRNVALEERRRNLSDCMYGWDGCDRSKLDRQEAAGVDSRPPWPTTTRATARTASRSACASTASA